MTGKPEKPRGSGEKTVKRVLADGTTKIYRYRKKARRQRVADGILRDIFNQYSVSPEFKRLAPQWQARKLWLFRLIESELGWMGLDQIHDRRARAKFFELRDQHADIPHRADKMMSALASALAWAYDRAIIDVNHAVRIPNLVTDSSPRKNQYYTEEMEESIIKRAQNDLLCAYKLALYTGLRRADLMRLQWRDIRNDGWLVIQPKKTAKTSGLTVHIPAHHFPPLAELLDSLPRHPTILATDTGLAWSLFNISHRWRRLMIRLEMPGMRFHDIRGTTATRLVEAGCTEAERGAVLGHAMAHGAGAAYVARTRTLTTNAYAKWWKHLSAPAAVIPLPVAPGKFSKNTA